MWEIYLGIIRKKLEYFEEDLEMKKFVDLLYRFEIIGVFICIS